MKNLPESIFLNLGELSEEDFRETDFAEARKEWEITWCEDKVHEHDIEYVRKDLAEGSKWHRYDEEKPTKELSALVVHSDTSFSIRIPSRTERGTMPCQRAREAMRPCSGWRCHRYQRN